MDILVARARIPTWSSAGGSRTTLSLLLGYSTSEMRSSSVFIRFIVRHSSLPLAMHSDSAQGRYDSAITGVQRTRFA